MSENLKTVVGIGALVVVAAAISAGLFVTTGSRMAVWFVLIGIPLIIVGGIATFVRGTVTSRGTSEGQFVAQQARIAAESFADGLRTRNELANLHPDWEPALESRAESLAGEFRTQGVQFDLEAGAFELSSVESNGSLQQIEQLKQESEEFETAVVDNFREFAESERDRIEESLDRIEDVGLVSIDEQPSDPAPGATPHDRHERLEDWYSIAADTLNEAIRTVRDVQNESDETADIETVDRRLDEASDAIDARNVETAAESVLDARATLEESLSGSFTAERDELAALLEVIDEVSVDSHIDAEVMDEIREIEADSRDLGSGLELATVARLRSRLRSICVDIVATMERDLEAAHERLQDASLPDGYYTEAACIGRSSVSELQDIDELPEFTSHWADVAEQLVHALDTAETKVAVVEAYDDVAEIVETELEGSNSVHEDDLPVRNGEEFLGLYARRNGHVEFDPSGPLLRTGPVETYELDIDVTYERGGPVRTAALELSGSGYTAETTLETRVAGTVTVDDVPAGTHTLVADPGDEEFATIERSITVEDDCSIEIEFTERNLRERVCEGVDIDVQDVLADVGSDFEARFVDNGYVSSRGSLPVQSQYAACLLVSWADRQGYDAASDGEEIIVFDRDDVRREIRNVITYNLEAGDTLSFEKLEENFLSAPVPPAVVEEVVSTLDPDTAYEITITDGALKTE